jgi:hypothetical protein
MGDGFRPVTRRSDLILAISILPAFLAVSLVSGLEKALAFAVAFGVFLSIIQTRKRRDPRFWAIMAILATIHVVVISLIHIPKLSAGIICLPFALVDGFGIWGFLNWVDRHFGKADTNT